MARVDSFIESERLTHGLVVSQWQSAGLNFRSNVLLFRGVSVGLHAHGYPHWAWIQNDMDVLEITPEGEEKRYVVQDRGRILIPAWHRHQFTLTGRAPGEVLCVWPEGL